MISGYKRLAGSLALALSALVAVNKHARADDPPPVYYISMRALQSETAPAYVIVVREATSERDTLIAGCDGRDYYATSTDAAAVSTARANGELVQLHYGRQGEPPQDSAIRCIIDAAGT
jgi:hypothetical protein